MIEFIYLSIMIIFLILGYMIRNAIMGVADNITDIAKNTDHIKYDMKLVLGVADTKGENENEKIH